MKAQLFLFTALLGVIATLAIPALRADVPDAAPLGAGRILEQDTCSGAMCRILVESDGRTVVDRGPLRRLAPRHTFEGRFRYQEERHGRVLYVYDDVQNLVGRIVNPREVRLLDAGTSLR